MHIQISACYIVKHFGVDALIYDIQYGSGHGTVVVLLPGFAIN